MKDPKAHAMDIDTWHLWTYTYYWTVEYPNHWVRNEGCWLIRLWERS